MATATFPECGECSVVWADEAYCNCFSEEVLKAAGVMFKTDACEAEEGMPHGNLNTVDS